MSSSSSSLPTPRQLLTSLLNAISEIPPPAQPDVSPATDALGGRAHPPPSNPLKRLDPSHRPLLTTLHVLFPALLLPALDLLDRGLVARLVAHPAQRHEEVDGDTEMIDDGGGGAAVQNPVSAGVYVVRSAQKPSGGGRRPVPDAAAAAGGGAASTTTAAGQASYVVHTAPWNCTCAAFAFAAFPPATSVLPARTDEVEVVGDDDDDDDDDADDGWGFGGMSFDGVGQDEAGVPPCCKHLLACVLAERWAVLGGYVNERRVGREELAGIFAGI